MSKSIAVAAVFPALLLSAVPALAQSMGAPSALRTQTSKPQPTINLGSLGKVDTTSRAHVKVFDGRDSALHSPPQPAERKATLYVRKAGDDKRQDAQPSQSGISLTKSGRGTLEAQPSRCEHASAVRGLYRTYLGREGAMAQSTGPAGALATHSGTKAPVGRAQASNNLKQLGTANACR